MGSNSGDHIAQDLRQGDIATCNTEEPQQKLRLGTIINIYVAGTGGGVGIRRENYDRLSSVPNPLDH